jgi:hypothetical protein
LEPIPVGPGLEERLEAFDRVCRPFFQRVLFGDPSKEAARVLSSIEGIAGEIKES